MKPTHTPRHLPGTDHAAVVQTTYLREVRADLTQMGLHYGIAVVEGDPGLGKSFAVDLVTSSLPNPTYWVDMPHQPSSKETTVRLYKAIYGVMPSQRTVEYVLADEVLDALHNRPCTLVIDEAQNLSQPALKQLRYFHDNPWTTFRPFTPKELRAVLDAYHPIFAATDAEVLLSLYEAIGGCFRNWARVLEVSHTLGLDRNERLVAADVAIILRSYSGATSPAPKRAA